MIGRSTDWRRKYAELITRKTFSISSTMKLNPHESKLVTKGDLLA